LKKQQVAVKVNGREYQRDVEPRMLLVDFIREELDLTGTHIGCDTGHCGACTVILDDVTVKSCMCLAVQAHNREILTVEGLSNNGILNPLQESFLENYALQCGYCTSGMLLSSLFLLRKNPNPTVEEIRRGIEGNLCRCTGYVNIVRAVKSAAEKLRESKKNANVSSST